MEIGYIFWRFYLRGNHGSAIHKTPKHSLIARRLDAKIGTAARK